MVDTANESEASPVVLVLGANAELLEKEVEDKKIHIAVNKDWSEGMASSVRCGLNTLMHIAPVVDSAIIMVCDQPFVTSSLLNQLIVTQRQTGKPIVTRGVGMTLGGTCAMNQTGGTRCFRLPLKRPSCHANRQVHPARPL